MNEPEVLRCRAETVLGSGEAVLAAGVFGLQDSYGALIVGGSAGAPAGLAPAGGAVLSGAAGGGPQVGPSGPVVGIRAARELRAAAQGLTARMLLAVTEHRLHLLDWSWASGPTRLLRSYERDDTLLEVRRFGLSRRLILHTQPDGSGLTLSGGTSILSAEAKGVRSVLATLSTPS